ncbi:MAG: DUF5985 family protein [Terriglobia bacterium]
MAVGFLLGVVAVTSLSAGVFFLKFWRRTRDTLFLAFAIAFIIEGANRTAVAFSAPSNEGNPWNYIVRFLAFLLILLAILKKNFGASGGR